MKKILLSLGVVASIVCHADTFNTKKSIETDFVQKDCTVVNLTEKKTFVNCNNAKYMITYDSYDEFYKIALINEKGEQKAFLMKN